ncbi:MAG: chromosomal replication initiator protein DnaA [bacterium]|nr:chromosomal replication initiator protein DnaA [bacterium]
MTNTELWKNVLGEIELQISRPNFLTWLKQSELVDRNDRDGVVLVSLPNNFAKEWVRNRYHKLILGSLRSIDSSIKNVDYVVASFAATSAATHKQALLRKALPLKPQQPLIELRIDPVTNLNPKYTFGSYVVGSSNELAHAAMQAVIENVGTRYNPLFIYGGVGLGKTHLLHAAGNTIMERYHGSVRVFYVTSEKFINDVVWAIRNRRMEDVKRRYRDVDVLIVDDIQFIAGKPTTELEFFYTFNTLHEHSKQIIISSDRSPAAIPTLEERLRSRFEGGMIADISYPDYEMRLAILNTKTPPNTLQEKTIEYIATKVQKNIRELEGVLNKVLFYQQYKNEHITMKKLDEIISETIQITSKNITAGDIIRTVADFFEVPQVELTERSRKQEIVEPRQITMYLLRDVLKLSYPHIGEKLGKRDHTTAIHAFEKISREMTQNPTLNQKVALIKERVYKGV